MEKTKGLVTIPTDVDVVSGTLELMERWGADALRDCDGTDFPKELQNVDAKIYSTYYTTRKDNDWARQNPDEIQQMYLMTPFYTAEGTSLEIPLMKGLYPDMLTPNTRDDIRRWWEVIDRTTGEVVPADQWSYDEASGNVIISAAKVTIKTELYLHLSSIIIVLSAVSAIFYVVWRRILEEENKVVCGLLPIFALSPVFGKNKPPHTKIAWSQFFCVWHYLYQYE